jgi:anaerobic selenocysteine-containing dehydrogenase
MRATYPDPRVRMNPADAAKYGVEDGQWVWIEGTRWRCRQKVRVNEGMMEGVVEADHGWWFPERDGNAPELFGVFDSNINNLTENCNCGEYSFGGDYRSLLCKIYPCTPENSQVTPGQQVVEQGGFTKLEDTVYNNPAVNARFGGLKKIER